MARGGARNGSGRKPGAATRRTREIADRAASEGITPLDYLLSVMRDANGEKAQRLDAAKAAAPYIHPRLSNVEAKIEGDLSLDVTVVELVPLGEG